MKAASNPSSPALPSRRGLLLATARAVCVTALTAGAALLLARNGAASCTDRTACGDCRLRDRCDDATDKPARKEKRP